VAVASAVGLAAVVSVAVTVAVRVAIAAVVTVAVGGRVAVSVLVAVPVAVTAVVAVAVAVGERVADGVGVLATVFVEAGPRVGVGLGVGVAVMALVGLAVAVAVAVAVALSASAGTLCGALREALCAAAPVPVVSVGVQFPPPVLLSQIWKLPAVERSLVLVVVGVNVQVDWLMLGNLLPAVREPRVTVSFVLLLLQA
jgi:hypothetical protein